MNHPNTQRSRGLRRELVDTVVAVALLPITYPVVWAVMGRKTGAR